MASSRDIRVAARRRRRAAGTRRTTRRKKTTTTAASKKKTTAATTASKKKTAARKKTAATPKLTVSKIEYVDFGFALNDSANYNSVNLKKSKLFKTTDKVFTLQAPCGEEYKLNIDRLKKVIEEAEKMSITTDLPASRGRY